MEEILEKIRDFADKAHGNQTRKYTTDRYIVHPVRVMEMCRQYDASLPTLAAALLHDVLEDTEVSKKEMLDFLTSLLSRQEAEKTTALVVELTDVYTKTKYPRWNRRKRKGKEADRIEKTSAESQTVKYADTIDNCTEIVIKDPEFAGLFLRECKMLLKRMQKGNLELYQLAVKTVEDCLSRVPAKYKKAKV